MVLYSVTARFKQIPGPRWRLCFAAALALLLTALAAKAMEDSALFDLSLDQLAQVEIKSDLTSIKAKPLREQPGIVSVVTSQEITETGARDLSDILMLVPGFALDEDVESMVGLTFRGLQGQEGKVLLIVDGIEVNDPLYGSLPILNHIPADAIQQVEIIRGPGSSMYGGTAGLAVIRVTTKNASQAGGYVEETPSFDRGQFANSVGAGFGFATNDWRLSANAAYTDTSLSNRKYTSLNGTNVDLTHQSSMNPLFLDFGAGWRDLDFRFIYDAYNFDDAINYGQPPPSPGEISFNSLMASAKYDAQPAPWLKITPEFTYRHLTPWEIDSSSLGDYQIQVNRYQADLVGVLDLPANSELMLGMRYFQDVATAEDDAYDHQPASIYYNGQPSVSLDDIAGFAQYDLDTRWANLSVGGRYEYHDAVGGHFVPRIALTKAWEKFHLKALYSQASRIPGINVAMDSIGPKLHAEQTANYELEAGCKFNHAWSWVANVFYLQVNQPIIYTDVNDADGYYNGSKISTAGLETQLRYDHARFASSLTYSYYRAVDNDLDYLRGDANNFLAAPSHKITVNETWHVTPALDWNLSGFWLGNRFAYAYPAAGVTELSDEFILNTFINYQFKHFTAGIGAANLLNQERYAPQPYAGGAGPLPLKGREFFLKLAFKF